MMLCCCTLLSPLAWRLAVIVKELVGLINKLEHQYSAIADLATFTRTGKAPNVTEFMLKPAVACQRLTGWSTSSPTRSACVHLAV
jgi:hypothetical protein